MDDIAQRLKDASEKCLHALAGWSKAKKDAALRGSMQEAVHELRKVAARLEIELAASEREDLQQRPIPIPQHRSQVKKPKEDLSLPSFITGGGSPPPRTIGDDEEFGDDEGQQPADSSRQPRKQGGGDMAGRMRRPAGRGPRPQRSAPDAGGAPQPSSNEE